MVPFFIVLLGSEDTVAGIAETWEDVVMIIELTIEGSCVDRHIRMSLVDDFNAFRCGYEAHELNVLYAFLLMAATALPPVASIGSTMMKSRLSTSGSLQ